MLERRKCDQSRSSALASPPLSNFAGGEAKLTEQLLLLDETRLTA